MAVFRYTNDAIVPMPSATFAELGIAERSDLQRLLGDNIEIIAPDTLVISEEFGDWDDSRRRIDLLGLDRDANLVVIELKRTEDGGHMELQALRYAAMVSTLTFDLAVHILGNYLRQRNDTRDAQQTILAFLGWDEPQEDDFGSDVRIVLASAEFSKELTTTVLWFCERDIDIRCVRIRPYGTRDNVLLDVQQVIPLPEAEDYQVRVREKKQRDRVARRTSRDTTRFNVTVNGQVFENLSKRRAIHAVVAELCRAGISPDQISEAVGWRRSLFLTMPGKLDSAAFKAEIAKAKADPIRWFLDDNELIHADGKTYALTNQWGNRTESAMRLLIENFGNNNLSIERAN